MRNRDPAPVQITAEQLLRESKERQAAEVKTPVQKIQNSEVGSERDKRSLRRNCRNGDS